MGSHGGGGHTAGNSLGQLLGNMARAATEFGASPSGYFGVRGKNSRVIQTPDPQRTSERFWKMLSAGGRVHVLPNGKGRVAWFADGSRIVYRVKTSTKGSPAVEIKVSTPGHGIPPSQKVHFISKGASG